MLVRPSCHSSMQLTKEITKVIDNFLHEKGIYGVDCDDLEHKIAETINGKEWGNDKGCDYSNTEIAYDVSELGYENCIR